MRSTILKSVTCLLALLGSAACGAAEIRPAPKSPMVALSVLPTEVVIDRPGATQQLVVIGTRKNGLAEELTNRVQFSSSNPTAMTVSGTGIVAAVRNGNARVVVTLPGGNLSASIPVTLRNAAGAYRWDFSRQVAPILVKAGCSAASCHGAPMGKGGFKLSFFGHNPDEDYETLTHGAGGRRVNRIKPGLSLLLQKPTMGLPHGGGKRFGVGSPEYRVLARWIASGAPRGQDTARVERLVLTPSEQLLSGPGDGRHLLVTAFFTDGTREDVSEQALFECKNEAAARVVGNRVSFVGLGEAPVLARFGGLQAAAQFIASPLPPLRSFPAYAATNVVDREVFGKLRRLRVTPADPAPDSELVRRLYLDLVGRIPSAAETRQYCESTEPGKREALIDGLLNGPEFPKHWRDNLNTLLMGRTSASATPAWAEWLESALKEDRGWDVMARQLLEARPQTPDQNGALLFLDSRFAQGDTGLDVVTRDVSRIFFGIDIQCARCHTHPEVAAWQQQAYWGIAAYFGRTYRIQIKGGSFLAEKATGEVLYFGSDKNQRAAIPMLLTGESLVELKTQSLMPTGVSKPTSDQESNDLYLVAPEETKEKTRVPVPKFSRRQRFVDSAITAHDPYFKRALVNWVWLRLMGRGLVEPADQMHAGNPPSHPTLLMELSEALVQQRFSLKQLIHTVVSSQTYARGSEWRASTSHPRERPPAELFAVAALRPLSVQQLSTSILMAAGYSGAEGESAPDTGKARAKFEEKYASQMAEIRRKLDSGTENFQPNVAQALFLSNNRGFQQLLERGGLGARLAMLPADAEVVRQAYLSVLSRLPDVDEAAVFERYLMERPDKRPSAIQQLIWALVTSAEFRFNH